MQTRMLVGNIKDCCFFIFHTTPEKSCKPNQSTDWFVYEGETLFTSNADALKRLSGTSSSDGSPHTETSI